VTSPLYLVYAGDTVCNTERYRRTKAGEVPEDVTLCLLVPSNYAPEMAPPGKQCVLASTFNLAPSVVAPRVDCVVGSLEAEVGEEIVNCAGHGRIVAG
jgi:phytoene dehydrogenase-like protein